MKKIVLVFVFFLLIVASLGYIFVIRNMIVPPINQIPTPTSEQPPPSPTSEPTTSENFCNKTDLQALVSFEGAAGNIYGTLTIKNISSTACTIIGNNKIETKTTPRNISFTYEGTATTMFTLKPNQTVYGQVHFPNGPQCSGDIITSPISFSYAISNSKTITFTTTGPGNAMITTCTAADEPTEIDLWNLSTTPFH